MLMAPPARDRGAEAGLRATIENTNFVQLRCHVMSVDSIDFHVLVKFMDGCKRLQKESTHLARWLKTSLKINLTKENSANS